MNLLPILNLGVKGLTESDLEKWRALILSELNLAEKGKTCPTYIDAVMMEIRMRKEHARRVVLVRGQQLTQEITVRVGIRGHVERDTGDSAEAE